MEDTINNLNSDTNASQDLANPTPGVAEQAPNAAPTEISDAEQQEWDEAVDELFPGINKPAESNQDPNNTETTTQVTTQTTTTQTTQAQPSQDQGQQQPSADPTLRDSRFAQRHMAEEVEAVKNDIRQTMFKDVPTEMVDSEGNPIRSYQDVMQLIDPRTKQPFTEQDAKEYFEYAKVEHQNRVNDVNRQVEELASVAVAIKDEADLVNEEYGELLKSMPEVQKALWAEYQKTLTVDPKTGVITKAPVSLARFYRVALQPYSKISAARQEITKFQEEAQRKAEEAEKKMQEAKRIQTRSDRSDIYAAGKPDTRSEEDKEWDEAHKEVFG